MASGPSVLPSSLGQRGLLLPGRPPPPPFPALSSPHTRPPRSWIPAAAEAAEAAVAGAAAAATLLPTAGTRRIWRPPGRGLAAPAPWRRWLRPSVRTSARPSAGNSTSTPSPSSPTSTPQNSCRPSCGARPSRRHPSLERPAATTERAAAREAPRVKGRAGCSQGPGGGLRPEFRAGVGGEDARPERPARGALTAAPAGLGGAPGAGGARPSPADVGTVWDPAGPRPGSATRPKSGDWWGLKSRWWAL